MRAKLTALAVGVLLAAGCGKTPEAKEATPEDEKAAEQRIKDEAARERKARQEEQKNKKPKSPDND
jgi:hypothetical protein